MRPTVSPATLRTGAVMMLSLLLVVTLGAGLGRWLDPTRRLADVRLKRAPPYELPDFALVDQEGHATTKRSLAGKTWVASFAFIECGNLCTLVSRRMARLMRDTAGERWANDVRFVSFSVAPEDGPPVLARFRKSFGDGDDARWRLLAADDATFPALAVKMGLADSAAAVPDAFLVTSRFMFLVDGDGTVRGGYDGVRDGDVRRLAADLAALAGGAP
jgi:protein SCO1